MNPPPSTQSVVFVSLFLVVYLLVLLRNTIANQLDLYDFLLLSSVALLPSAFVFLPELAYDISSLVGVTYPFVLLFAGLFLLVFVYLYRLLIQIYRLNQKNIVLVQELSLVQEELKQIKISSALNFDPENSGHK